MNSIIMSIRPEWSVKEMNGIKTEEIRKNLGKLKPPFKVYAYVTKGKPYLYEYDGFHLTPTRSWSELHDNGDREWFNIEEFGELNGKVCFEFVCDQVSDLRTVHVVNLEALSCLTREELQAYYDKGRKGAYSLHISELKVYDRPKELGEFHKVGFNEAMKNWEWDRLSPPDEKSILIPCPAPRYEIKKSPQSWQFVEELK